MGALALAMLVVGLDATVLNVALPTIAGDLHASTSQLQWVASAYVLALAGAILPAGVLGDRFGRKKLMLVGLGISLLGSIGGALTDSIGPLIAWRTVMGIGAAIITPIVMAMVPLLFNDEDRPKAVGVMTASISLGLPLGPIVGGYLLNHYHWSSIFWINVPFVLLALVAVTLLVQESRDPSAPALDYLGAVLSAAGIVTMVYGFVEAPDKGWVSFQGLGFIVIGLALIAAMIVWQTRTASPLIDLSLFRNTRFVGGIVAMILLTFVLYGLLFTLPSYLQAVRGNDAFGTGLRLLPMMVGLLIAGGGSKRLLTRVGAGTGVAAGTIIVAATMGALSFLTVDTSMWWIGIALAVFGLGLGMAMTSAMDAVLGALPREKAGSGSGVLNTMRQVSGALGVAVLGSILSSVYTGKLDDATMASLPAPAAKAVKDSVVGASSVAESMGSQGVSLQHMAGVAYTDAMSVLLIVCAIGGVVAAAISGYILRDRKEMQAASSPTAAQERLQL
ncbi:MAG TPA: DHA2 family efflux MFS transporter permease subunit [Thermomicrobiales bacterium]|nr:DHA2 family efflux MFS transporter permease subunit [Thermomicrobiales bacterium]